MNLQEIKIDNWNNPIILFSDSHTNTRNIDKLRELYPKSLLLSLGDLTFLFSKKGEKWNEKSIQYFIDHKIPACVGNHESHLLSCSLGNSVTKVMQRFDESSSFVDEDIYDLTQQHIDYLKKLPIGFKLILPDGKNNYLLYHNAPNDLWGFREESYKEYAFIKEYPVDNHTISCVRGHEHKSFTINFPNIKTKLTTIGRLSVDGEYAIITEKGLEFKKL